MPRITSITIPAKKEWHLITYDGKEFILDDLEYKVVQEAIKRDVKFVNFGTMTLAMSDIRRIEQQETKERIKYDFED